MSEEQKVPTKDEVIAFLKEQIEVKTAQLELQELNTKLAVAKAEELKALSFIGQITDASRAPQAVEQNPEDDNISHTITQEDLDNNPELAEEGVKVGDEILIPKQEVKQEAPIKKLKKN